MNLFFWRIFLSFWLANVLIAGGLIWTTGWIAGRDDMRPVERVQEFMDLSFRAAVQAVEGGNVQAVAQRQGRRGPVHVAVFDEAGLPMLRGRPRLSHADAELVLERGGRAQLGGRQVRAASARAPDGKTYLVAMATRAPPSPLLALSSEGSRLRFLIALVTSGAISFALARYFAGPIRRLRRATQQLARGDLTAQVDVPERKWGDDLVQLGREFNDMARRLRASYEAQTNLLLDVSHELRSPLARLQVAVELLQRRSGVESAAELERIELEAAKVNGLIGEILDLTRHSSSGVAGREPAPVDLIALLEDVCEDARFEAGENRDVAFITNQPGAIVDGHASGLRSCFENLVRNALQHGQSRVSVTVDVGAENIVVRVADTGPGVPDSDLDKLFEPFFRSAAPPGEGQSHHEGFGLGLAIVKAVVDSHSGALEARSPAGGGLEVEIRLPLASG